LASGFGANRKRRRSRKLAAQDFAPARRRGLFTRPSAGDVRQRRRRRPLSNTTTTYLSIADNLARYQKLEAGQPSVKTATAYYKANISKVKTIGEFVDNYRLLSYALQAYGLGDQISNTALIKEVLEQGTSNPHALANTLPNANWKTFASAFNFSASGAGAPSSAASVSATTDDYNEQQLEADQGQSDPGVELALYFARVAPTVTNGYGILANKNLLEVVQTIFGLAPTASASQIDEEAKQISKLVPVQELQDPTKLKSLVERFTAAYDAKYGLSSTSSLTVDSGNTQSNVSAASSILAEVVSANSSALAVESSYSPLISPSLLAGLALGG
jgi:hypothetical protein